MLLYLQMGLTGTEPADAVNDIVPAHSFALADADN